MPITFNSEKNMFNIETKNTKYVFQIVFGKYPVHIYYGAKEDAQIEEYKSRSFCIKERWNKKCKRRQGNCA